jgi:hypothetical protein
MPKHRFSIVIPTRERARTLAFTLRTCLVQEHDDFEVVVSDNHSSPATREVVDALAHPRLRYVRTPAPLAMTDSFEFAISQADGEFILMLGDDDGLLAHALPQIDRIIRMVDARALRWESVVYHWPDFISHAGAMPDRLLVPLKLVGDHYAVRPVTSADMIRAAANFDVEYPRLPMSYCSSVVHHSLCDELRRRTGRVFLSESPDVYSAFAFAYVAGSYHSVNVPMAICGLSGHSNGVACLQQKSGSPIATEFHHRNAAAGHVRHRRIPALPSLPACVADSFQYAKDALFPDDGTLVLDRRRVVTNSFCFRPPRDETEWQAYLDACRSALADDARLLAWFEQEIATQPFSPPPPAAPESGLQRYGGFYMHLETRDFGVCDVVAAAALCEKLLGYRREGIEVDPEGEDESAPTLAQLQEKEAVIQHLVKCIAERDQFIAQLDEQVRDLVAWRQRWMRPLRRGVPHLLRKVVRRLLGPRKQAPVA